jgi:hypothetical protein
MKKKTCLSVYIALLFLIFLVVLFPYKEGFEFKTIFDRDVSGSIYDVYNSIPSKNSLYPNTL